MVERVLIQDGQMSVSLPGIDVNSANMDQMAFDSRWSGHRFFASGFIDSHNDITAAYTFPTPLPNPPLLVGYVDPSRSGAQFLSPSNFRGNSSDFWYYAVVHNSDVQFRFNFGSQVGRLYFALFKRVAG